MAENKEVNTFDMFKTALNNNDLQQAIRLVSSVKALQTKANIILCCKDSSNAFDLLRFVPLARQIKTVLEIAATETRVARLIADDIPDLASEVILRSAINGEQAWADRYKLKFSLSNAQIKKFMSRVEDKKSSVNDSSKNIDL